MSAGILQDTADLFSFFDAVFTETDARKIEGELKSANMDEIAPRRYLSFALGVSLLVSSLIFIFSSLFITVPLSLFLFFSSFAVSFFLVKNYPRMRARRIADEIESELPIALRSIGVELNMNTPFEHALEHAADSNYGALSLELRKTLREIRRSGRGVPDALRALGARVESTMFRRALSQLLIAYEQGTKGEPIKKLADEMMDLQRARAREFSAKSAFFGLLLIAVSCIFPAMFEVYLVVSSSFMRAPLSPSGIWLVYLLVFPLFNLLIILYLRSRTPRALRTQKSKFLSPEELRALDEELRAMGIKQTMKTILVRLLAISVLLAIFVFFLLRANQMLAIPLSLVLLLSPVLAYAYVSYRLERRTREIERYLPDALFHAASMQKGVHIEKIISSIAGAGYGSLSGEFELARRQIKGGASVPSALGA
ncbi:MAG: type II secretion system F family protein, partial [Candidatus Micrarchaeota archaeon]